MTSKPLRITPGAIAATILAFIAAGVCVRLGFWQLDRLEWRVEHNRVVSERLALPPLPVTSAALDTTGLAYRRVELRGAFDDARAFVLAGRAHQGMPGVHLITPLRLEGGGGVVLVNRGWLRAPDAATVHLEPSHAEGPVRLTGLAVPFFPKQPPEDERRDRSSAPIRVDHPGPDDRAAPVWFRPDDDAVRASLPYPVADFIVQALPEDAGEGAASQPIPLEPPELDRGPHLGYAIQWFSFAAVALIGWGVVAVRRGATGTERERAAGGRGAAV